MSHIRVNYQQESEDGLNELINNMLYFAYNVKAMVYHFDCADVALRGFSVFYRVIWDELIKTVDALAMYQNKRGGCVKFRDIKAPDYSLWSKGIDSLQFLVKGLQIAYDGCNKLHDTAKKSNDPHLQHFIGKFL
jgi:ferritin